MTQESVQERIEREASRALFRNAIFRIESALMVGGTLLAPVFLPDAIQWIPWFAWPILGLAGEVAIVFTSLTDKAEQKKVAE